MGKTLGGNTARTANSNWLQGYSMPYDVCSVVKSKRKGERRRRHLFYCVSVLIFESSHYWSPASKEADGHLLTGRELIFAFSLLPCMSIAFALLNCFFLDPKGFFPYYFLPPVLWKNGLIDQLWGHLISSQGQLTTVLFVAQCGTWGIWDNYNNLER